MVDDIAMALDKYKNKWQALVAERAHKNLFADLVWVSVGWKVADETAFDTAVNALRNHCDLVIHTRMNNRWIAKMVLRDPVVAVPVIKIMQVRPGATDALGLDHVDFYSPQKPDVIEQTLQNEGLKWSHEVNHDGDKHPWASVWFAGTEAKIKHYSVLDIYADQLAAVSQRIKQGA